VATFRISNLLTAVQNSLPLGSLLSHNPALGSSPNCEEAQPRGMWPVLLAPSDFNPPPAIWYQHRITVRILIQKPLASHQNMKRFYCGSGDKLLAGAEPGVKWWGGLCEVVDDFVTETTWRRLCGKYRKKEAHTIKDGNAVKIIRCLK